MTTHTAVCAYGPCSKSFTWTAKVKGKPRRYCSPRCGGMSRRKGTAEPLPPPPPAAPAQPVARPAPHHGTPETRRAGAKSRHQEVADRRRELVAAGGELLDVERCLKGGLQKPGRDPVTRDVQYAADELEFLKAAERYKREKRRPFPTLTELLAVLRSLGWRKVAPEASR